MAQPPRAALIGLGVILVAAVGVAALLSGGDGDPEAQIRAALDRAARAAEERDVGEVMEIVSEGFESPSYTRDDLRRALFVQLRADTAWKRVVLTDVEVELDTADPERAKVRVKAILAKGDTKDGTWRDVAPSDAAVHRFDLDFAREDGDWRVRQVVHRRAGLTD